jgi:hypothetical protein
VRTGEQVDGSRRHPLTRVSLCGGGLQVAEGRARLDVEQELPDAKEGVILASQRPCQAPTRARPARVRRVRPRPLAAPHLAGAH